VAGYISVLAACESESGNDRLGLVLVEMCMICGDQSFLEERVGRWWVSRVEGSCFVSELDEAGRENKKICTR
jgi:hypothetical protein